ncbi:hypothetical protein [Dinghuibacter silviterrae]|uniref:Uncharacterized protein n=1 Tax=Dinghuibacter silviterrae TaxID=1539049 RepID=A0A4R8DGU4_9BACT|nr:hypothetical protein [Dinghuibacter silviterrae]TDW96893.1 hypothetical protein EDB95_4729 [Dinghuibacter silviterrae]
MKLILCALISLAVALPSFSQFKRVAESSFFDEPTDGYAKLLHLKSGYTAYLHIDDKAGIELKLFDATHHLIATKGTSVQLPKHQEAPVRGIFEVNGDVVVMVREYDEHTPILYRIIFDGATGNLKKNERLLDLDKVNLGNAFAMAFGHVPLPDFYVRKDPHSDYYAVVMLNSLTPDRNKRLEIVSYGPDHKEIARAFYLSPDGGKYKYLNFIDMAPVEGGKVSVLAYAYNNAKSGGRESELVLATLDAGAKEVTLTELPFNNSLIVQHGCVRYNPVTQKLLLLAAVQPGHNPNETATVLAFIDPFAKKLLSVKPLLTQKVNAEDEAVFGEKNGYTGVPVNMFVNADGTFTVVFEELTNITQHSAYDNYTMTSVETGNLAVCKFDAAGVEKQSYLIPKSHFVVKYHFQAFYASELELSATELNDANQYKSFAYIDGANKSYVLFNDIEKNGESAKKGKLTTIRTVTECDGFYFPLEGADLMPDRQFVFGRAENKKEHDLAVYGVSDYDRDNNVYTTLELDKEGRRDKQVRVVWLQPE